MAGNAAQIIRVRRYFNREIVPVRAQEAQYRANNPDDRLCRDFDVWAALENEAPFLFAGMYGFWCRRPVH
jgi:hypothetical protein